MSTGRIYDHVRELHLLAARGDITYDTFTDRYAELAGDAPHQCSIEDRLAWRLGREALDEIEDEVGGTFGDS